MLFSLLTAVSGDYVASHSGCEAWCSAVLCSHIGSCSSCSFCKGPQRLEPSDGADEPSRAGADEEGAGSATSKENKKGNKAKRTPPVALEEADSSAVTHFWDCCKPSCGWDDGQGAARLPLRTMCDPRGVRLGAAGVNATSACDDAHGSSARAHTVNAPTITALPCHRASPPLGLWLGPGGRGELVSS